MRRGSLATLGRTGSLSLRSPVRGVEFRTPGHWRCASGRLEPADSQTGAVGVPLGGPGIFLVARVVGFPGDLCPRARLLGFGLGSTQSCGLGAPPLPQFLFRPLGLIDAPFSSSSRRGRRAARRRRWGPARAGASPSRGPQAPRPLGDRRRWGCGRSQDEGRRGGRGRTGPVEPGGGQPRGLRHVPGVRAPRLPGPHGGQPALPAGAQLAPPLPQPGQAQSLQPHVCPAVGLRHGEGREGRTGWAKHAVGSGARRPGKEMGPEGGQDGTRGFLRGTGRKEISGDRRSPLCRGQGCRRHGPKDVNRLEEDRSRRGEVCSHRRGSVTKSSRVQRQSS